MGRGGEGGRGRGGRGVNGFTLAHPVFFGNPGRRCRTCQLFYVDDFGNLIPIVNTHSVFFPKINTHSGDCALSNSTV